MHGTVFSRPLIEDRYMMAALFETGRGRVFGTRDGEYLLKAMDLDMLHISEVHIRATVFD